MSARMTVRADLAEWPALVRFIEGFAARAELPDDERSRLLIVLEELLTNLVKYGYDTSTPRGSADVGLAFDHDRLVIDFDDDGRAFDPLDRAVDHLDRTVEERPVGGLGLHLIRAMADEASYTRDGGRNRLRLVRLLRDML